MSIHETMKQITEAAEKLIAPADIQSSFIISEEQLKKHERRIIFHNDASDKIELVLGDEFEVKVENGKTFVVRKQPSYPKTYEECLKILGYNQSHTIPMNHGHNGLLMMKLQRLLICRDAYWKLAGDWKPYWSIYDHKFCIGTDNDKVIEECVTTGNRILAFPTKEMRDAFYENFNGLIEECKELL